MATRTPASLAGETSAPPPGFLAWARRVHALADSSGMSVAAIQRAACAFYGVQRGELLSARRRGDLVRARFVAIHLARELTDLSLPTIGRLFGGRDHTTILNALRRVAEQRRLAGDLRAEIAAVRRLAEAAQ